MINTPDRHNNRKIVAMDDTLADPLTGRLLDGRYAVTARIAHGGMATVYRATDTRLDREVALKVMHAELARDEEFVRRFIGEAKSVARLSHQNVVAVFDQGADGPYLYLAMEYVPGRTLKELLRDSGRFPPAAALEIMAGVLDGLAAAHASGIVHRDVKPENVLLTADGRIKVADFGLARAQWAAGHTRAGLLVGIYLTSLSVGAILSSLLSVPLYRSSGDSVRLALGIWAIPAALAVLLDRMLVARHQPTPTHA